MIQTWDWEVTCSESVRLHLILDSPELQQFENQYFGFWQDMCSTKVEIICMSSRIYQDELEEFCEKTICFQ